jgi:hypothetical protein
MSGPIAAAVPVDATSQPVQPTPQQPTAQESAFDATMRALQAATPDAQAAAYANPAALGAHVVNGLHGFQLRSAEMQALMQRVTQADPATAGGDNKVPAMFGLIVDTFNFAIETQLVARAATQFTGSLGSLMRGS